jgi:lipoate-protein ligase A
MWSQTPAFSLLLDPTHDVGLQMKVHHGIIKSLDLEDSSLSDKAREALRTALVDTKMQDVWNSKTFLQISEQNPDGPLAIAARRLKELLPVPELFKR